MYEVTRDAVIRYTCIEFGFVSNNTEALMSNDIFQATIVKLNIRRNVEVQQKGWKVVWGRVEYGLSMYIYGYNTHFYCAFEDTISAFGSVITRPSIRRESDSLSTSATLCCRSCWSVLGFSNSLVILPMILSANSFCCLCLT